MSQTKNKEKKDVAESSGTAPKPGFDKAKDFLEDDLYRKKIKDAGMNAEFLLASKRGNLEEVKRLLEEGVSINTRDSVTGQTGLMIAAIMGHIELVQHLIEKGADVRMTDNRGLSAYMLASYNRRMGVAELIHEHTVKIVKQQAPKKTE